MRGCRSISVLGLVDATERHHCRNTGVVIRLFIITPGIGTRHAVGSSKNAIHFAADECLCLQPRLGLLFFAAYG
jgi:hypothetical protein